MATPVSAGQGFPLSNTSETGIHSTNLLCFCLLASEAVSNLDLFALWVSLWELPSLLWKLFPGSESPRLSHKSSCPGNGAELTAGTTLRCLTEAVSARSEIRERTRSQWKTVKTYLHFDLLGIQHALNVTSIVFVVWFPFEVWCLFFNGNDT